MGIPDLDCSAAPIRRELTKSCSHFYEVRVIKLLADLVYLKTTGPSGLPLHALSLTMSFGVGEEGTEAKWEVKFLTLVILMGTSVMLVHIMWAEIVMMGYGFPAGKSKHVYYYLLHSLFPDNMNFRHTSNIIIKWRSYLSNTVHEFYVIYHILFRSTYQLVDETVSSG